jgi:hypothetical protein
LDSPILKKERTMFLRNAGKMSGRFRITIEIFLLKDLKWDNQRCRYYKLQTRLTAGRIESFI